MARLISQSHVLCIETFQQLCEAVTDPDLQLAVLDELDKYKVWSQNLGASHSGRTYKLSLDYRLREATFYKDQVMSIIDTLQKHVENARQIVCGERKPFEDFSESESDEESSGLPPSNDTPYGKGHDSPWESSSESGSVPKSEPIKVGPKASDETSGLLPPATELAQLLEAIKLTIRSLYKLPIRKPVPVDHLKGTLTDAVSCFQPFDCMYVQDKFPRLSLEVANRIANHITRRRQLLLYRQGHQEFFHSTSLQKETTSSQPESEPQTLRSKETTFIHDGEQSPRLNFLSAPSVAESNSKTSIAASQVTRKTPVEVPPRPKDLKGISKTMFECKFCALTTQIESDIAWKKHVLSDLQPYVCTFPGCNLGDHMFENRNAWFQHELQIHRFEYFCNVEAHPTYRRLLGFQNHMQREHDISPAELSNPAAMNIFRHPSSLSGDYCNLCFRAEPVRNMKSHVSKHLEQISLFAIPRAEYGKDDVDAGDNQSYQAQQRLEESTSPDVEKKESVLQGYEQQSLFGSKKYANAGSFYSQPYSNTFNPSVQQRQPPRQSNHGYYQSPYPAYGHGFAPHHRSAHPHSTVINPVASTSSTYGSGGRRFVCWICADTDQPFGLRVLLEQHVQEVHRKSPEEAQMEVDTWYGRYGEEKDSPEVMGDSPEVAKDLDRP